MLGVDNSTPKHKNIGKQESMLADLLGGLVDHELTRMDLLNIARDDELDTPEALALLGELHRTSDKLEKTMGVYDDEYGLQGPMEPEDEDEDRYDGFEPEPYYDHIEAQSEQAKEDGNSLTEKIMSKISIVLFIFLPVFTLFLMLIYIRRSFTYMEHLVFVFHTQTVFFLLLSISETVDFPPRTPTRSFCFRLFCSIRNLSTSTPVQSGIGENCDS